MRTQYIGARYVPVFADPLGWTSTRAYEPLTIVLWQGDSYASRQTVPVGTDITDERYWAKCADYNAQFAELQESVSLELNDMLEMIMNFEDVFRYGKLELEIEPPENDTDYFMEFPMAFDPNKHIMPLDTDLDSGELTASVSSVTYSGITVSVTGTGTAPEEGDAALLTVWYFVVGV